MDRGLVVAVDGGGVKTDLALLDSSGALLSFVRGGGSQAYYLGVEGCVEVLEALLDRAMAEAGLADPSGRSRRRLRCCSPAWTSRRSWRRFAWGWSG